MTDVNGGRDRPALRTWAVGVAAAANAVAIAALVTGDHHPPLLVAALGAQYVFCVGALRGNAGATMALVLWELTTAVAFAMVGGWLGWMGALATAASGVGLVVAADEIESPRLPSR